MDLEELVWNLQFLNVVLNYHMCNVKLVNKLILSLYESVNLSLLGCIENTAG